MGADLPRRWRWAIGLACALAAVLGLLFVVVARPAGVEAAVTMARAALVGVEAAAPAAGAVAQAPAPPAAAAHGAGEIQVCGGAWVKATADGSLDEADVERATQLPQARARILANMQHDPSELARAATLLLAMIGNDEPHRRAALGIAPNCEAADCPASTQALAEVAQARDALARLAVSATDPRVYALAFKVCGGKHRGEGACQLISAEQWARLDPGNASPWLSILAAAKARDDRAAQDEALFRIARAQRSDLAFFAVAGAILDATPDDDNAALASLMMVTAAIGVEAAVAMPAYTDLTAACRGDALRDANRAQTCAAIADVLADHSDTLIERAIGGAIGRQVGWPAERSDRMRGEYEAYIASLAPASRAEPDFGCAPIRRELDLVSRRAALGETGVLREWIANSGKTADDFVRARRARQQADDAAAASHRREQAASAAAASAASAATASLR